ncbi:MAG TPA: cation:proton antiporter [Nannocystis sp.]
MAADLAHHIEALSIILGTAAVTSLVSQRLKQPPVLGYILAGIILGEHATGIAAGGEEMELTHALSELGVILLMFTIGIEFSLRKIVKIGPSAGLTAVFEVGLMVSLGYLVGRLFGWKEIESLFLGACLGISSTMLVAKAFEEQKVRGGFAELTFAVLVFEDLIAILLLAILTAVASGTGLSPGEFALTIGKLFGFLIALLAVGLMIVPRFIRGVVRLNRAESTLIAGIGVCFAMATFAIHAGYSVALGAFLAGMLVSESGEGHKVEHLVMPLRDIFAAIFFISVGMSINPFEVAENWLPVLVCTVLVILGKTFGVSVGSFLSGNGLNASVRSGMSLSQIGEFSFIIASLGYSKGATGSYLFPIAVAVSILTSLTTPLMVRRSEAAAARFESGLPSRLQTFVSVYERWIEQLRSGPRTVSVWSRIRHTVVMIAVDAGLLVAVLAGAHLLEWRVVKLLSEKLSVPPEAVDAVWIGLTILLALIFVAGVIRQIVALAHKLAEVVLPKRDDDKADRGSVPRRVFTVALQIALTLVIGLPLVAISQPFLPPSVGLGVLVVVLAVLLYNISRSLHNLQGQMRAGSALIVEVLAKQSRQADHKHAAEESQVAAQELLPGIPGLTPLRLDEGAAAIGHSLQQINLGGRTGGASVVLLNRAGREPSAPSKREKFCAGDILLLSGPDEAVAEARKILIEGPVADPNFLAYLNKGASDA